VVSELVSELLNMTTRLQLESCMFWTLIGGNMLWSIKETSLRGSLSSLLPKPFMMRSGAAYRVVVKFLKVFLVSCWNFCTSLASAYSSILKVIVGPLGFLIILI